MGIANREGALYMATGIDNSGLYSGVKQAEGVLQGFDNTARRIGTAMGGYFIFNQFKELSKDIINVRSDMQMLEVSFEALLGSKQKADSMIGDVMDYVLDSPYSMQGLSKASQLLLGFNVEAEKVIPTLKQLGDIAMGDEGRFNSLSLAFAQMSATGRLMGQDLNQMINAGFNPLQEMSVKTGKSIAALKKEMEGGAISSEMVANAFASATAEGGRFYNMAQKQASGIRGSQNALKTTIQEIHNEIGKSNEELIAGGYKLTTSLVRNYEKIGGALAALIATYTAYKVLLASQVVIKKSVESVRIMEEAKSLEKLLTVEQAANISKQNLKKGTLEYAMAVNAESAAHLDALKSKAANAAADVRIAKQKMIDTRLALYAQRDKVVALKAEFAAAQANNNVKKIATVGEKLNTAAIEQNTLARDLRTQKIAIGAVQEKAQTAYQTLNTTTLNTNTIATNANAASKAFLSRSMIQLRSVVASLWATMVANPLVLLAAGVVALGYAVYKVATAATAAEEAQRRFNKAQEEAKRKADEQKQGLEELIRVMQDETSAQSQRLKAMNLIKEQYPQLFAKYVDEKGHVKDLIGLWKEYNEAAEVKTLQDSKDRAQQIRDRIRVLEQKKLDIEDKNPGIDTRSYALVISTLRQDLKLINKDVQEQSNLQWEANTPVEVRKKLLEDEIAILKERNKELSKPKNFVEKDSGDFPLNIPDAQRIAEEQANLKKIQRLESDLQKLNEAESKAPMYGADYKAAKTEWEEAKVELAKIAADKNKFTTQQYEEAKKAEEAAKKKYEELGGVTRADKQTKDAQKEAQKIADANLELIKAEKKAALDREQAKLDNDQSRLNLEEDSFNKRLKQIELNHKKEQLAIERHEQQLIEAQQARERKEWEKSGSKGIFTPKTVVLSGEDKDIIDERKNTNNEAREAQEKQVLDNLTQKYQDYAQQREAIEKKFNDDIAVLVSKRTEAEKNGQREIAEAMDRAIAQATANKGKELMSFDFDRLKESPEYVRAFEDLKNTSTETLNSLLNQLESAKHEAAKVLTPDQLREYTSTIRQIMDELMERSPFDTLVVNQKKLADASLELTKAEKQLQAVRKGAKIKGVDGTYLTEAKALKILNKAKDDYNASNSETIKAQKIIIEDVEKLAAEINNLGNVIGGVAGEALSLTGDMMSFVATTTKGIKAIADTSTQAISSIEKASVVLSMVSAGMSLISKLTKSNEEAARQSKQRENSYWDAVNYRIEKQIRLLKELKDVTLSLSTTDDIQKAKDKVLDSLQNSELKYSVGKEFSTFQKDLGEYIKEAEKSGNDYVVSFLKGIAGGDWSMKGMNVQLKAFAGLSEEELIGLKEHAEIWAILPDYVQEAINRLIGLDAQQEDVLKTTEEIERATKEMFTGVSFDSFRDSFIDGLIDIDSTAEDVANNIEKYFQRAMLKSLVNDKYADQIRALYDQFSAANEDGH